MVDIVIVSVAYNRKGTHLCPLQRGEEEIHVLGKITKEMEILKILYLNTAKVGIIIVSGKTYIYIYIYIYIVKESCGYSGKPKQVTGQGNMHLLHVTFY